MRQMINKDNTEQDVKNVTDEMKKWAGDDAKKRQERAITPSWSRTWVTAPSMRRKR